MTGLKDRQRLALYVALGLSAGSGLTLDASTAYAADPVNIAASGTAHASGINATQITKNASNNELNVGETSPAVPNTPVINGDVVGGYSDAYAVTHNTVTINSMAFELPIPYLEDWQTAVRYRTMLLRSMEVTMLLAAASMEERLRVRALRRATALLLRAVILVQGSTFTAVWLRARRH